jgi:hypothetical protein
MLVQQPDTEALPGIGGGETLTRLFQADAVALAQHTDVGGVHVGQRGVALIAEVPHRQHRIFLILGEFPRPAASSGKALLIAAPRLGCGGGLLPFLELQMVKLGVDAVVV